MIYLKKGQTLFDNPGMVVYDSTGYYDDGTSVICSPVFSPEEPACRYEAKYIAYGGIVYSISDEKELLKQVLEMDPNSLLGKDSKQVAVDKIIDKIVPQETSSPDITETLIDETNPDTEEIIIDNPDNTSTTTPSIDIPVSDTSTTTPIIDIPTIPDISTTTPSIDIPVSDTSTTTPIIDVPTVTPPEELLPTDTATSTLAK